MPSVLPLYAYQAGLIYIAAYLLGSISFAVVVSQLLGLSDPRTYGSKNPGATNVLRTGNKLAAALTLLGDGLKGWLAVFLAGLAAHHWTMDSRIVFLAGLAAFVGHLWPIFFRFVGGKGVATALGVLLGINVWLGLAVFATWLVVAWVLKYSSLAALVAAFAAPLFYGIYWEMDVGFVVVAVMSALLVYRHRANIENLLSGKESKIGSKKK